MGSPTVGSQIQAGRTKWAYHKRYKTGTYSYCRRLSKALVCKPSNSTIFSDLGWPIAILQTTYFVIFASLFLSLERVKLGISMQFCRFIIASTSIRDGILPKGTCSLFRATWPVKCFVNKVGVLHVRLTDLHAAHQNLPFPPNRTLPLKQYQYQGRLW